MYKLKTQRFPSSNNAHSSLWPFLDQSVNSFYELLSVFVSALALTRIQLFMIAVFQRTYQ